MSLWRSAKLGLRTLIARDAADRDLDDEVRHVAMAAQENIRKGMTTDAAERAARVQLGGVESVKTLVRTGGWEACVDTLAQDIRVAVRGLRRTPAFALVVLMSLALGIGAATTMFSLVNAVMFRSLPYADADRLALVWTDDVRRGLHREATAYLTITDWQARSRTFGELAYFSTQRVAAMANDPASGRGRTRSALVSANLFPVLGVTALKGRLLSSEDERERAPVVVIGHDFWQRHFAGAGDVVGRTIAIDDASKGGIGVLTVIGVLPPGFYFPDRQTDLFTPATTYWRFARESTERFQPWARRWTAIGRLAPGASIGDARAELHRIGQDLASTYASDMADFPGFSATVMRVLDSIAGVDLQSALLVLLGAVGLVLVVVCVNVANLELARGASRQREFALRRALGAGRVRIVRQLAVETLLLAVAGGLGGLALAAWATPLIGSMLAGYLPRMSDIAFDGRVLSFGLMAAAASGLLFGVVPGLRLSSANASEALREGNQGTSPARVRRSQGLFVLAECVLALVLLAGAGLLLKSLNHVLAVDAGFDPRQVLTLRLEFSSESPPTPEERTQTSRIAPARARAREQSMQVLLERVRALPGVATAAFTDDLFLAGQGNESITIPGRAAAGLSAGELNEAAVTPEFFETMRVPLRRGRYPTQDDAQQKIRALWSPVLTHLTLAEKERRATPEPVAVNEAFVRRFFPSEDPIGKRFCIDPANKTYWYEILGVVGDMRRSGLERTTIPEYYGPYFPSPAGRADLVVRTEATPLALAAAVRSEVTRTFPMATIVTVSTADAQLAAFSAQRRLQTWLLTLFAAMALSLAAVGIFGLAHYAVAERTREIGVRMALGATPASVLRLVIAQGMRMPLIGIAFGLAAAAAVTRAIANQLFHVEPTDPATFATVALVLAAVAAGACWLAARRATGDDPMRALRQG